MEKNYNFGLIYKKHDKTKVIISSIIKGLIFGLIAMLVAGFLMGYRVYSVMGWSSEPDIHFGSIVIDYKVPYKELKVGDYITWSRTGNTYVTHKIIEIDYSRDYIVTSQTEYGREDEEVDPDKPITYKNVYGKVVATIPEVGNILVNIRGLIFNNRTLNILGIMTILLTGTAIYLFGSLVKKDYYTLKEY